MASHSFHPPPARGETDAQLTFEGRRNNHSFSHNPCMADLNYRFRRVSTAITIAIIAKVMVVIAKDVAVLYAES
jgi:hypothetical protein